MLEYHGQKNSTWHVVRMTKRWNANRTSKSCVHFFLLLNFDSLWIWYSVVCDNRWVTITWLIAQIHIILNKCFFLPSNVQTSSFRWWTGYVDRWKISIENIYCTLGYEVNIAKKINSFENFPSLTFSITYICTCLTFAWHFEPLSKSNITFSAWLKLDFPIFILSNFKHHNRVHKANCTSFKCSHEQIPKPYSTCTCTRVHFHIYLVQGTVFRLSIRRKARHCKRAYRKLNYIKALWLIVLIHCNLAQNISFPLKVQQFEFAMGHNLWMS